MAQSRLGSAVETAVSTAVGYVVAIAAQLVFFPLFGVSIPFSSNLALGVIFTGVSLIRGYALRRFFNWLHG